jgi:hypothetical protein
MENTIGRMCIAQYRAFFNSLRRYHSPDKAMRHRGSYSDLAGGATITPEMINALRLVFALCPDSPPSEKTGEGAAATIEASNAPLPPLPLVLIATDGQRDDPASDPRFTQHPLSQRRS